jgi:hypothetical protein
MMDSAIIARRRRIITALCAVALAAVLPLITRSRESLVTIVFPVAAIFWMIAREHRMAREGERFAPVPLLKRLMIFGIFPAFSVGVILFWAPSYAAEMNPWVKYGCASFCLALVLVKIYERYLLIRSRVGPPIGGRIQPGK